MFGRIGKMAILLDDFLNQISVAVSNVNLIMENVALEQYMQQGYDKVLGAENGEEETYRPITYTLALQGEENKVQVPVSAMMHNKTMKLDQVDIKLKCKLEERDGKVYVDCKSGKASDNTLNEINLLYKNDSSSEGISRITDNYLKTI